jgi:sugar lactone lactonase YvrE
MAVDSLGNLYFSDSSVVRKVDAAGIITTVAGNGSQGYSGDGGPATAAQLYDPTGICFDKAGNLYIIDKVGNKVRKVNTAGIISTIAGSSASHIILNGGNAIATDDSGNIYIDDYFPFEYDRIRKINTAGTITTFAGGGSALSCNGCPATSLALSNAYGLAIDRYGNVYVSDGTSNRIHKITPAGVAYHIAGNNISGGYSGDGGPATAAALNTPTMLCIDPKGDLLFADRSNYRFRKISLSTNDVPLSQLSQPQFKIYPNPHTGSNFSIHVSSNIVAEEGTLSITNTLGQKVYSSTIATNSTKNIHLPLNAGLYFVTLHFASGTASSLMICD